MIRLGSARLIVLVLVVVILSGFGASTEAGISSAPQAIPNYVFDIVLDYPRHSLDAVERVTVQNPAGKPLSELVFNVPAAHEVGTFLLHQVLVGISPADFDFLGTILTVTLPSVLLTNEAVTVTLDVTVLPGRIDDGGVESFAAANLGFTDDVMTVGYWYPILAPYQPGRGWLIVPWHTVGDPFASEVADYTATIMATHGVEIVAGGETSREDNVWHFDLPRGRTFAFLASPNYLCMDVTLGGVTYSLYTFVEHTHLMPVAMQTIVRSAWLYSALYGPYPYATLRVAEVSGPWSMEFTGLATLGAEEFADYNGTQRNRLVRIAAHEVSHQWWYGVVGNDQAREPWLDESLARFNELRYYEFYSPGDAWWWWDTVLANSEPHRMVDSSVYDFHFHNSYIGVVYNRGAILWDALRAQMGAQAFDEFMRDWYQRGAFRLVTFDDLLSVLAEHSRADLRPVMRRYLSAASFEMLRSSDTDPVRPASQDRGRE